MEAEHYKDIITWLYLHRYRSWGTDTWWWTTLCFLGRWEDCIIFLQICRNMIQSSQQKRGIHPILFLCWADGGNASQHWNSLVKGLVFAGRCHCVEASACWCSMPAIANVAQPGQAWRHRTDLINQLDRGGLVDPVNCIYIHGVHWVDLYAVYWATRYL